MSDFTFFVILLSTSAIFGTTIGAYYCTIEYRIRANLPLVTSGCICPSCGHRLALYHQIPILSFFLLKGKCHYCHAPIPFRYPLTEAAFLTYYTLTFCMLYRFPLIFISLWYLFVMIWILKNVHTKNSRNYNRLLKGLLIITAYHAVIGLLYIILYLAVYGSFFLNCLP
ncbi:MAG: prepilin peptidase [Lachnospiraceae bacterium]|nr:prepilin peptidase [Lachnospiraceae bacterium]